MYLHRCLTSLAHYDRLLKLLEKDSTPECSSNITSIVHDFSQNVGASMSGDWMLELGDMAREQGIKNDTGSSAGLPAHIL